MLAGEGGFVLHLAEGVTSHKWSEMDTKSAHLGLRYAISRTDIKRMCKLYKITWSNVTALRFVSLNQTDRSVWKITIRKSFL